MLKEFICCQLQVSKDSVLDICWGSYYLPIRNACSIRNTQASNQGYTRNTKKRCNLWYALVFIYILYLKTDKMVYTKVLYDHLHIWSDFQTCQEIWSFLFRSKSELVRDRLLHCTKVGLARHPTMGRYTFLGHHQEPQGSGVQGCCCPGPGSGWGNPVIPPASTDAESPSNRN